MSDDTHRHGEHHHHHHHSHHHGLSVSNSSMDRDNRRTQFQRAALIMPAVLFAIGLIVWGWGMNYNGLDQPSQSLVTCGGWMMGICGGIFLLLLLADWTNRAKKAIHNARQRRETERTHRREHHHHHHHHHHLALVLALAVGRAFALCSHEVLVLANDDSVDSVLVASSFMRLHDIPESNLVRLEVPEAAVQSGVISAKTFTEAIWEPACRAVEERGLQSQILAWVYSCDFPFCVKTKPELSITGLTFLRNRVPEDMQIVEYGAYRSPVYAGPWQNRPDAAPSSRTFDRLHSSLLDDMPLPAMMLGWTGMRGNTVEEVLDMLERGRASDGTRPSAAYVFATNNNVRSTARAWEFAPAVRVLEAAGVKARITASFPNDGRVAGFMTGREKLPASKLSFAPGAFADHLTSSAGDFRTSHQTQLSEWIRRGATASAGTVTEPKAYWQKFPAASVFLHQRRGCTMIEAIYLATACPLQLLPVGDPLASPWAERPRPRIEGAADGAARAGAVSLRAVLDASSSARFDWLVDGRRVGSGRDFLLDTTALENGPHAIRLVARARGDLRIPGEAAIRIVVAN